MTTLAATYRWGRSGSVHVGGTSKHSKKRWAVCCSILLIIQSIVGLGVGMTSFILSPTGSFNVVFWVFMPILFGAIMLMIGACAGSAAVKAINIGICFTCFAALLPIIGAILEAVFVSNLKQIDFSRCSFRKHNSYNFCGGKCHTEIGYRKCVCCYLIEEHCSSDGTYLGSLPAEFDGYGSCEEVEFGVTGVVLASMSMCLVCTFLAIVAAVCGYRYRNVVDDDTYSANRFIAQPVSGTGTYIDRYQQNFTSSHPTSYNRNSEPTHVRRYDDIRTVSGGTRVDDRYTPHTHPASHTPSAPHRTETDPYMPPAYPGHSYPDSRAPPHEYNGHQPSPTGGRQPPADDSLPRYSDVTRSYPHAPTSAHTEEEAPPAYNEALSMPVIVPATSVTDIRPDTHTQETLV